MKSSSFSHLYFYWQGRLTQFIRNKWQGFTARFKREITKSKESGEILRPSLFLYLACLFLMISAFCKISASREEIPMTESLQKRGWKTLSSSPCANLAPEHFYEAIGETASLEFYLSPSGEILASTESYPDSVYQCHPITEPTFIEEIP